MIAVLAKAGDAAAEALVRRWRPGARLMTARDLTRPGWVHRPGSDADVAVIDSEPVAAGELRGVVTQLPFVAPDDLAPIVPADRPYVAAEMTAFLLAWLSSLPCPVVNRPSPLGLAGPNLRPEAWMALASEAGIPVRPVRRDGHGYPPRDVTGVRDEVTVVGKRTLGATSTRARERALRLARQAGAEMMVAIFDAADPGGPLLDAHTWPDLTRADVAGALLELLTGRAGSSQ